MEVGDIIRITNPSSDIEEIIQKEHGYLWRVWEVSMAGGAHAVSLVTGKSAYWFASEFEPLEGNHG